MRTIDTTITIAAPPGTVWDVLVDFGSYHEWNPFIRKGAGDPVAGTRLTLDIQPPGDKLMTHHPIIQVAEPGRHLQWLGVFKTPLLLAARHEFVLEAEGDGTKLRQREYFSGIAVLFLARTLRRTEEGFHALNLALKQRAESSAGVPRVE
ncbi:MAG: SRPBCC domain-containing protein [Kibdelosporangium sp.]